MSDTLISIIIPVYNGEKYLAETIESVIIQTYPNIEIIVIDDGSTDQSDKIAAKFIPKIQYYFQKNQGISAARNTGVNLVKGDFIAFLDADDIWLPDKLTRQMEFYQSNPDIDFIFTLVQQFHSPELTVKEKARLKGDGEVLAGCFAGSLLIRKDTFLKVGNFNTKYRLGEFIDWCLRAQEKSLKYLVMDEILMKRRLHKFNMGILQRNARVDFAKIIKAAHDRRYKK